MEKPECQSLQTSTLAQDLLPQPPSQNQVSRIFFTAKVIHRDFFLTLALSLFSKADLALFKVWDDPGSVLQLAARFFDEGGAAFCSAGKLSAQRQV